MKLCLECGAEFDGAEWGCPACGWSPPLHEGFPCFAPALAAENEGFSAEYFDDLAALEEASFWFRSRNRLVSWALDRHFPAAANLLEIGCGTGFVLTGMLSARPGLRATGGEIFLRGLQVARRRLPSVELLQLDGRRLPYRAHFDVVAAFDVLEHIEEDDEVLREMWLACRRGGGIALTVPQHPFLWSRQDEYSFHKRRYTRRELVRKLKAAGFTLVAVTSIVSLLLPVMLASRLHGRWRGAATPDPRSELRLPRLVDGALEQIMAIERRAIQAGISLPAGGSLLAIARK
jgi:SAM-dependent methyltransferase